MRVWTVVVIIIDSGYFWLVLPVDVDMEFAKSCHILCIALLTFYYFMCFSQGQSIEGEPYTIRANA